LKILTTKQMKDAENKANAGGMTFASLMENAGAAVAQVIEQEFEIQGSKILLLIGPGNNGGDGLVAARHLAAGGASVALYIWKRDIKNDPNWALLEEAAVEVTWHKEDRDGQKLVSLLEEAAIVVDALLGTGVTRAIEGDLAGLLDIVHEVVEERRAMPASPIICPTEPESLPEVGPVIVALDIPSGLNSDTGALDEHTLAADLTVTMAAGKRGLFLLPGAEFVGRLFVADIGIAEELIPENAPLLVSGDWVRENLPERPDFSHKGTFGKALIVAGSVNYTGAAYLSAASALRTGAGLVTLATPQLIFPIIASKLTEATYLLLPHDMGVISPDAVKVLAEKTAAYQAMLIGPGIGTEEPTSRFLELLLGSEEAGGHRKKSVGFIASEENQEKVSFHLPPLIVDADGLNMLAKMKEWWKKLSPLTILTPHPGEMARLIGGSADEVNSDRLKTAGKYASEWGHIVVLKGAQTVIAHPDGRSAVLPFANPALATAGSGDVLAGALAGLLAQGLEPFEAAVCGGYLHGLAGELCREQIGDAGATAGDILERLPQAIRTIWGG
jgi:ADP-dependent NAD(P)H-hydrate dehydratase / NAD(P)H-hydrate epimerase